MPKQTPVEKARMEDLKRDADMLMNGYRGNVEQMCIVLAGLTHAFVASIGQGGVTPEELEAALSTHESHCRETIGKARDWKSTLAWSLPACGSVLALAKILT